jgi:hypothetical protein
MTERPWIVSTILLTTLAVVANCSSTSGEYGETETEPEVRDEAERPVGQPVGEAEVLSQEVLPSWRAAIESRGPGISLNGEAVANAGESGTFVSIDVEGGQSGAVHPWHVHVGDCDGGGSVVGAESAYPPLQIGAGGEAEAQATIEPRLDPEADYHVNIHLSAAQTDSIIACGALVTHEGTQQ